MYTKVAIFGAGCSCSCGYPLANQTKDHLEDFAKGIVLSAPKLHKITRNTLDLFNKLTAQGCPAQTIDDLAWLVHQGKIPTQPGTFQNEHDDRLVEDAKTVISAMFIAKEHEPVAKALKGYRNFLRRIFPNSTHFDRAIVNSPWRILTFNYDRLFELALRQHFDVDMTQTFYGPTVLNSGLRLVVPDEIEIDNSRFSLLKLHGSVGFYGVEEYGSCVHYHMIPDPMKAVPITDDEFFFDDRHGIYSNKPKPSLIVFPHEKDQLTDYPNNRFPFRIYIPEIWRAAKKFLAEADEICIVGYSVPDPDWSAFESLMQAARNCRRIIVQDPVAENICSKLRGRLPGLADKIKASETTFESGLAM